MILVQALEYNVYVRRAQCNGTIPPPPSNSRFLAKGELEGTGGGPVNKYEYRIISSNWVSLDRDDISGGGLGWPVHE